MPYEPQPIAPISEDQNLLGNSPIGDVSQGILGKYYDSFRPHEAAITQKSDEVMGNMPAPSKLITNPFEAFARSAVGGAAADAGLILRGVKALTGGGTEETGLEKLGADIMGETAGFVDTWNAAFDGDPETDYHWDAAFGSMLGQVAGFMIPIGAAAKGSVLAARGGKWAATKLLRQEAPKFIEGAVGSRMKKEGAEKVLLETLGEKAARPAIVEAAGSEEALMALGQKLIARKAEDRISRIAATGALYSLATGDMTAAKVEDGQEMTAGNRLEAAALAIPATALMSIVPTKVMDTMFHAAPVQLLPKALTESATMDSFKKVFYDEVNKRGLLFRQHWSGRIGQDAVIQGVANASNEALKAVAGKSAEEPWAEVFNQEFAKRAVDAAVSGAVMGTTFGGINEIAGPKQNRSSISDRSEQQLQATEASRKISADGVMVEGKGFISPETVAAAEAGAESRVAAEVRRMKDESARAEAAKTSAAEAEVLRLREEARSAGERDRLESELGLSLEEFFTRDTEAREREALAKAREAESIYADEPSPITEKDLSLEEFFTLRGEERSRSYEKTKRSIAEYEAKEAARKAEKERLLAIEIAADNAKIDAEVAAEKARKNAEIIAQQEETQRKQTIAAAQKRIYDAGVTEARSDSAALEAVRQADALKQRKIVELTDTFNEGKIREFLDSRGEITRDTQSLGELKNQAKRYVERRTEEVLPFLLREVQAKEAKGAKVEPALARTWDELSRITKDKNEYPIMGKKDLPAARAKMEERFSVSDEVPKELSLDPEVNRQVRAKHAVDVMRAAQEMSWNSQGTRRVNIVVHTKEPRMKGGVRAEGQYDAATNTVHLYAPAIDLKAPGAMERLLLHEDFGHNVLRSTLAVHGREILGQLAKVDPKTEIGKKIQETTALYRKFLDEENVDVKDARAEAHIQEEVLSAIASEPKLYKNFWKRMGFTAKLVLQKMGFNPKFTPEETITAALRESNKKYMREMKLEHEGVPMERTLSVKELKDTAALSPEELTRRAEAEKTRKATEEAKAKVIEDKAQLKDYQEAVKELKTTTPIATGETKKAHTERIKALAKEQVALKAKERAERKKLVDDAFTDEPAEGKYSLRDDAKEKVAKTYEEAREKITRGRSLTSILFDRAEPIKTALGERAYLLKRLEAAANTVVETALRNGNLMWKYVKGSDHLLTPEIKHNPGKGLDDLVKKHGSERWKAYWNDRRARRVMEERADDKDLDISDETLRTWREPMRDEKGKLKSSWGTEADFAEIDGWVNKMNNDILNFGLATGAIGTAEAKLLRKDLYVPLYRGNENMDVPRRFSRDDVSTLGSVMKKLEKAGEDLQDPMAAMINNWSTIVRSSMQNRTRIEAIKQLKHLDPRGIRPSKSVRDPNRMGYFDDGEQKFVTIKDPGLFNALAVAPKNWMDNTILDWALRKPKQWITQLAVLGPVFRVKNLVRDTASVWMQNKGFTPMDTYRGLVAAWNRGPEYTEFLASGGGFRHGWLYGDDMGAHAKDVLYKMGKHDGTKNIVITGPKSLYDAWMQLGDTLENANRLGLYMKEKKAGKSEMQAAFSARDTLDFALTGNSEALGFMTQYVPFLNSYMQGLYKTGRTATGKDAREFWVKMGGLAAVSAAIYASTDQDKRAALTDQQRMNFWHFWVGDTHLMLPKPFELGLGASWAEIVTDMFNERKDTRDVVKEFWNISRKSMLSWNGLLPSDYMPVLAQPIEEVAMNKSRFTGNPIVPMGLENKPPEEQVQPWTPEMYKLIAKATGTSPLKVEHILRGYMGTIADGAAMFGDMAVRGTSDGKPAMKPEEYPIMYGFMHDDTRPNRYRTEFYDTYKEIDTLKQRIESAVEAKDAEGVKELVSDPENRKLLAVKSDAGAVRELDGQLKKIALRIQEAPGLSPADKRTAIDAVQSERNRAMLEFREKLRWVDKRIKESRT